MSNRWRRSEQPKKSPARIPVTAPGPPARSRLNWSSAIGLAIMRSFKRRAPQLTIAECYGRVMVTSVAIGLAAGVPIGVLIKFLL
jgi:hypothetical protein